MFLAFVLVAVVIVALSASARSDARVLAIIFSAALFLTCAENLLDVRYIFHFCGLLCVFLAWVVGEFMTVMKSQDPRAWRRWGLPAIAVFFGIILAGDLASAFSNSSVPKSGIRALARNGPLNSKTLHVIAPDYLASTFAFYAREERVAFRGPVRWDHPEVFRVAGYAADWNDPKAIDKTLKSIAGASRHYMYLDLILEDYARDQGRVPLW